jgi:hypothetical protein
VPRIELISTPYAGKSIIASGQECINMYAEINLQIDPQAPAKTTYYPTPGSTVYADPNFLKEARCAYRTSLGTSFYVVGQNVYFLTTNAILVLVGSIADLPSQVYMIDNGIVAILVDGMNGYVINLATNQLGFISDPNFYPADYVVLLDTFFILNRSGTDQFFITASNASFGMLTNTAITSGTLVGGSLYTNGTYSGVALTGGSGTGATADITVSGGAVTIVQIDDGGMNYVAGDVLTATAASIGGTGSGFTYTVTTFASAFDPLDIAAKSGFSDPIVGLATVHRELWLIGNLTTEVWIDTGAADFPFQEQQGAYINHGCAAKYSIATMDVLVFFMMQDQQGNGIIVQGQGYDVTEISTPRTVSLMKDYTTITDAIGFCFQIGDHPFYALIFPQANKGWLYDVSTKQWNEWNWVDNNGQFNRPRANCCMFVNGFNLVGDWENGQLLLLSLETYLDNGQPIVCVRTFPHVNNDNVRTSGMEFMADMEVGTAAEGDDPQISLSWSDNKGVSYGNPVTQSLGQIGEFFTVPTWHRLGHARDRVYKLSYAANCRTALNGAFLTYKSART